MQEVFERRNDLPTVSTRLGNSSRKNTYKLFFRIYFCEKYITLSRVQRILAEQRRGMVLFCSVLFVPIFRRFAVHREGLRALEGEGSGRSGCCQRCETLLFPPKFTLLPPPPNSQEKNTGLKSEKRNVSPRRLTKKFIRRIWSINLVHEFLPRLQP